jgi:Tfp pilus assembly protein PilO
MSDPMSTQRSVRKEQFRRQLARIKGSRRQGMFGVAELLAVAVSVLVLLVVLVSYFYFLLPAQSRLTAQLRERDRLQASLRTSNGVVKHGEDTKQVVARLVNSMDDFELKRLSNQTQGRMDLYDELNDLIGKNGLRNTSGPTYTTLEAAGSKNAKKSTSTKWQSVYPGIAVAVTVESQYQNLRHFIKDIETSKQFIIINGVELERATETNTPLSAEGAPATPRGSLVSLRLDLATYFQREPAAVQPANGEQK